MTGKQSSAAMSSLAGRVLGGYETTRDEIEALAASVLSQDETKGQRRDPAPRPLQRSDLPMLGKTVDDKGVTHFLFAGCAALHIWGPKEVEGFLNPRTGETEKGLVWTVPASEFKDVSWETLGKIGAAEQVKRDAAKAG